MGVLRFYLCTKAQIDVSEEDDELGHSNVIVDEQLNDVHERDEQLQTEADSFLDISEVVIGPYVGEPITSQLNDTLPDQPVLQIDDDLSITSVTLPITSSDLITLDITSRIDSSSMLPPTNTTDITPELASTGDVASSSTTITVKLHRVNLLEEMIGQFKDEILLKHNLRYTYIDEKGADVDGISRDVYAAFWTELMDHTAEGEDLRVPSLCPKWQEEEWKSIGRILLKGFQDHGYFPCRLSPAFAVALIFGENEVSDDVLFESLLFYVSQSERNLIKAALKEGLSDEDQDELIDLLDRLDVTAIPTKENLKSILLKVAHKQLIQKPRYASKKISITAGSSLKKLFGSPQGVLQMYENKKPTTKKLLKLLSASPSTQAENQSFRFLQQYIRGLDDAGLRRILRFVTGSDVICVNKIEVMFTAVDGLGRRPVAHT